MSAVRIQRSPLLGWSWEVRRDTTEQTPTPRVVSGWSITHKGARRHAEHHALLMLPGEKWDNVLSTWEKTVRLMEANADRLEEINRRAQGH